MVEMTVQTTDGASVTFDYDMPETIDEAFTKYGKEVVEAFAIRGLTVAIQGHARAMIKGNKTADQIKAEMASWTPGMPRQAKTAEEKFNALWEKMSPEDRAKIQKSLKASKAAA